jgi:predicted RNA-binding protein with RPS1 domain
LHERYQVGTRVHGKVRNLTDFGAFIEIEDGVDGLVHVSDISWSRRIKHPSDVLKKGQEIDAIITSIDAENRRLSLSIKDLEPNAWDRFVNEHNPGDVVKGKIARFANFGAFVELDDGLEGLCHISELSEERVEKPEDVVKLGQEMEFKILRIDSESNKIGLSARAVGKDEPIVDAKVYSSQVGSGMASLGELADFGLGRVAEPETKSEPEAKAEAKTKDTQEAKAQSASEPEPEAKAEPAPEAASEPPADAEAVREPEPEPAPVSEPITAPEPVSEPAAEEAAEPNTAPPTDEAKGEEAAKQDEAEKSEEASS